MRDDITPDETPRRGRHLASNLGDNATADARDASATSAQDAPRHTDVDATPASKLGGNDGERNDDRVD